MDAEGPLAMIHAGDSRLMAAVPDGGVDLVVTSPPYWHIKDYGKPGQIGFGQSLHAYLGDLLRVWRECFRAVREGGRLCVNVGDQFARASVYGRYRVIPLHAEIIRQGERAGFDSMGSIIWQKRTTMNTSGGAVIMGSFPYPPNGIVELDYEHILLFRKPGRPRAVPRHVKEASALSKEEWKAWFSGHWSFAGARKAHGHEAEFPVELPRRLIRMFSFIGDTVLDPFLGRGTTALVALELGRNTVGFEINGEYAGAARDRVEEAIRAGLRGTVCLNECAPLPPLPPEEGYLPGIADALPPREQPAAETVPSLFTVRGVTGDCALLLDGGLRVRLLGLGMRDAEGARRYLESRVAGKKVLLREEVPEDAGLAAYVYLKNRIFVNAHLLKTGLADPDGTAHRLAPRFARFAADREAEVRGPAGG